MFCKQSSNPFGAMGALQPGNSREVDSEFPVVDLYSHTLRVSSGASSTPKRVMQYRVLPAEHHVLHHWIATHHRPWCLFVTIHLPLNARHEPFQLVPGNEARLNRTPKGPRAHKSPGAASSPCYIICPLYYCCYYYYHLNLSLPVKIHPSNPAAAELCECPYSNHLLQLSAVPLELGVQLDRMIPPPALSSLGYAHT